MKSFLFSTSVDGPVDNVCSPTSGPIFWLFDEPPVCGDLDHPSTPAVDNPRRFRAP